METLYLSILVVLIMGNMNSCIQGEPQVPCFYIFGDSLVDAGNNNNLNTSFKVNYPPYGIDFPLGPTGRFCNGRTAADIIGERLGFDNFIPPFANASGSEILEGVNYASGSAGIRNESGKYLGDNIDLKQQIKNHGVTISRIADILGNETSAKELLNKCLYMFVIGTNDYVNNYFLPQYYNTSELYSPEQYAQLLIEDYDQYIETVYNYGARKVALVGIGPVGCTPNELTSHTTNGTLCVDYINEAVNFFNDNLKSLVDLLNHKLVDAKFVYLDTYGGAFDYPPAPGVQVKGCCETSEESVLCINGTAPCGDRNLHTFWDAVHPTEIYNQYGAEFSYLELKKILGSSI